MQAESKEGVDPLGLDGIQHKAVVGGAGISMGVFPRGSAGCFGKYGDGIPGDPVGRWQQQMESGQSWKERRSQGRSFRIWWELGRIRETAAP